MVSFLLNEIISDWLRVHVYLCKPFNRLAVSFWCVKYKMIFFVWNFHSEWHFLSHETLIWNWHCWAGNWDAGQRSVSFWHCWVLTETAMISFASSFIWVSPSLHNHGCCTFLSLSDPGGWWGGAKCEQDILHPPAGDEGLDHPLGPF